MSDMSRHDKIMSAAIGEEKSKLPLLKPQSPRILHNMKMSSKMYAARMKAASNHHNLDHPLQNKGSKVHWDSNVKDPRIPILMSYHSLKNLPGNSGSKTKIEAEMNRHSVIEKKSARELRNVLREKDTLKYRKLTFMPPMPSSGRYVKENESTIDVYSGQQHVVDNLTMKLKQQERLHLMQREELKSKYDHIEKVLKDVTKERDEFQDRVYEVQDLLNEYQIRSMKSHEDISREDFEQVRKVYMAVTEMYDTIRSFAMAIIANVEENNKITWEQEIDVLISYVTKPIKICLLIFLYLTFGSV